MHCVRALEERCENDILLVLVFWDGVPSLAAWLAAVEVELENPNYAGGPFLEHILTRYWQGGKPLGMRGMNWLRRFNGQEKWFCEPSYASSRRTFGTSQEDVTACDESSRNSMRDRRYYAAR